MHSNPDAKVFLIGNKIDLEDDRKVSKEHGTTYAKNYNLNLFMEASAKTGFNAQNIFIEAARILYDDYLKYKDKIDQRSNTLGSFKPITPNLNDKKKLDPIVPGKKGCLC